MAEFQDDKIQHCLPFILDRIQVHRSNLDDGADVPAPFFLGLNGIQGAGKTTLVETMTPNARYAKLTMRKVKALYETLTSSKWNLPTAILSIDDLYLPHSEQQALATAYPDNPLIAHRGQPSTHDVPLGISIFEALHQRCINVKIPIYDKSAYNGSGDRLPIQEWQTINREGEATVDVVIFEGWCVGFRPLPDDELRAKWSSARQKFERDGEAYEDQLGKHNLTNLAFINTRLRDYEAFSTYLNAFIHIDAIDTHFVYKWRLQQETSLRASKNRGMSDEEVIDFVNGYYPSYELYCDTLRRGIFGPNIRKQQLRLVVDEDRRIVHVYLI